MDKCVFNIDNVMYVLYTDDSIISGTDLKEVEKAIENIKSAKLDITIEVNIQYFLGFNIDHKPYGTIHLTQSHLVDKILNYIKMGNMSHRNLLQMIHPSYFQINQIQRTLINPSTIYQSSESSTIRKRVQAQT